MENLLHLIDHSQTLPGGTVDKSVEFFVHNNDMWCRSNGVSYPFEMFPAWIIDIVNADMAKYPEKIVELVKWGLLDSDSQMKQYLFCLYGGHDDNADIDTNGVMQQSEYVDCGLRCGKCSYEGKLCNSLKLVNGTLSAKEISFLKLSAVGRLDKEIADELCVSEHTVRYYKDQILEKAGLIGERKAVWIGLPYTLGMI